MLSPLQSPGARWLSRLWLEPVPLLPAASAEEAPERALLRHVVANSWDRTQAFTRYMTEAPGGALALAILREDAPTADAELILFATALAAGASGLAVHLLPEPDPDAPPTVTQGDVRESIRELTAGLARCGLPAGEDFFSYIEVSHGWSLRWRLTDAAGRELARGGRYDGLIGALGGHGAPAACARVSPELLAAAPPVHDGTTLIVAPFDSGVAWEAFALAHELRAAGLRTYFHHGAKNLRRSFKEADRIGASTIVVLGGHEWEHGEVTFRNAATRAETRVRRENAVATALARRAVPESGSAPP